MLDSMFIYDWYIAAAAAVCVNAKPREKFIIQSKTVPIAIMPSDNIVYTVLSWYTHSSITNLIVFFFQMKLYWDLSIR